MTLETSRLTLRPLTMNDAGEVYKNLSSNSSVTQFLPYEKQASKEATEDLISSWLFSLKDAGQDEGNHVFAIILKSNNELIGVIDVKETDKEAKAAETSYQIGKPWWGYGYATEALEKVIEHSFSELGYNRLWGRYEPRNANSGKVMEKAGMVYEGLYRQYKARGGKIVDRVYYGVLKSDVQRKDVLAGYNQLPVKNDDFVDLPALADGDIQLICLEKEPADPARNRVLAYHFAICKGSEKIGDMRLRVGYTDHLYYVGHLGCQIAKKYRGNGYAEIASKLVAKVAQLHGMNKLIVTTDLGNVSSRRTCEKLGARLVEMAPVPADHEMYRKGARFVDVYEWDITGQI